MAHYLHGQAYRHSFVFNRENLPANVIQEIEDYIAAYQKQEETFKEDRMTTTCNFYSYEKNILDDEGELRISLVYVVVLYSSDWLNFIEELLQFHDTFHPSRVPRASIYSYVLRDENREFDDFV
jgi:hypothetical protein